MTRSGGGQRENTASASSCVAANVYVALDQLGVARPWPWSPDLFRVQREIVQPRLEGAVLGGKGTRQSLDEARALATRWR